MKSFVESIEGNIPLIISVPHGGSLSPSLIKNREHGCFKKDRNTIEIAKEFQAKMLERGLVPYFVIMKLHRRKIDVNRGSREGASDENSLAAYKEYHKKLMRFRKNIKKKFGGGVLIDLHGQSHRNGLIELGYSVPKQKINKIKEVSKPYLLKHSSIASLIRKGFSGEELIVGSSALGSLFEGAGYPSLPSNKHQNIKERHMNGVYILHRHVVTKNEGIIGINLELCYEGIRDTKENLVSFSGIFAQVVIKFLNTFYKI